MPIDVSYGGKKVQWVMFLFISRFVEVSDPIPIMCMELKGNEWRYVGGTHVRWKEVTGDRGLPYCAFGKGKILTSNDGLQFF